MEKGIITLPLSPTRSNELARFTPPLVGDAISKSVNGNFHLCINILDSYNDRSSELLKYKSRLSSLGIIPNELWIDNEKIEYLIQNIYRLIEYGYIYEKELEIYICDCGKIEIDKNNLSTVNPLKTSFKILNGDIVCNHCHSICHLYKEKVLVFDPNNINTDIRFYPNYLNKDIKTFEKIVNNSYVVISRNRSTGISINYNNSKYNIDIDFIWEVFLTLFPEEEKIVVCGNKEIYQMYLCGLLEKILNKDANTLFVGIPIINGINKIDINPFNEDDILTKKLAILLNITWNAKVKEFDYRLLEKLKKIPYERKLKIYNIMINPEINNNDIESILRCLFNYQEITKVLKRRS